MKRTAFLLILFSIMLSNTFSPQYLIWLAPFAVFLSTLEAGMFIFSCFLTWFYFRYTNDLVTLQPMVVSLLILRNLVLLLLFLICLFKLILTLMKNNSNINYHTKKVAGLANQKAKHYSLIMSSV